MRILLRLVLFLVVILVVAVLTTSFWLGGAVKKVIERSGPELLGVPVTLEHASFSLFRGHVSLRNFVIGNPEGYQAAHAMSLGEVSVDLVPKSLMSDTIVIKRFFVSAPEVNYELALGKSNIGVLMERIESKERAAKEPQEPGEKKPGKKLIIEDCTIEQAQVSVAAKMLGAEPTPLQIPDIHLNDIGREAGGATPVEVAASIIRELLRVITQAVTSGGMAGNAEAIEKTAKDIEENAKKTIDAVKGIFGK
jgi:uncharacterized protein involved in outer membrane biogenesis